MKKHHERYIAALRVPAETERRARFMRGWEIMRGAKRLRDKERLR
jgi:hypothetical protein